MVSGLDEAFKLNPIDLESLTSAESEALFYVIKSKNLENLISNSTSYYINIPNNLDEKKVRLLYPNFIKQLELYREKLEKRYSYGRELPFWEWAFKRSEKYFLNNKPKIVVPCKERVTNKELMRFSWLEPDHVSLQDVTALSMKHEYKESNEYLLAYLNHAHVSDWIRNKGIIKGGIAEFSEKPIQRIPFRRIDWSSTKEVKVHDEITEFTKGIIANKHVDQNQKDKLNSMLDKLFDMSIH
jgi:adenine-specific DNA-methyltransferase